MEITVDILKQLGFDKRKTYGKPVAGVSKFTYGYEGVYFTMEKWHYASLYNGEKFIFTLKVGNWKRAIRTVEDLVIIIKALTNTELETYFLINNK
jgi:hypothetical protein